MPSLGRHLRDFARQHGVRRTTEFFREARKQRKIQPQQISLRDLAEGLLGPSWATKLARRESPLREASEAVDASAFSNITGQLLIDQVKERYQSADFIADQLVEVMPVTNGNLGTNKVPWLSDVIDAPSKLTAGEEYPFSQFSEQYVVLPAPEKYGLICGVTFEMIFSDLTKQAMDAAGSVGRRIGISKEERVLRVVLGLLNNHVWNGTTYNTYLTAGNWINKVSSQQLTDWTSLNAVEQLFANMLDPVTGKAIDVPADEMALLVMPFRKYNAKRAIFATETRSGDITTGAGNQEIAPNPLDKQYPILSSKFAYQLLLGSGLTAAQAQDYWYCGAFKKAFAYRQVFPLTIVEAPPQNLMQFRQDIVLAIKASEYGVAGVMDPRYVAQSINT